MNALLLKHKAVIRYQCLIAELDEMNVCRVYKPGEIIGQKLNTFDASEMDMNDFFTKLDSYL